jgi:hypothetical protein
VTDDAPLVGVVRWDFVLVRCAGIVVAVRTAKPLKNPAGLCVDLNGEHLFVSTDQRVYRITINETTTGLSPLSPSAASAASSPSGKDEAKPGMPKSEPSSDSKKALAMSAGGPTTVKLAGNINAGFADGSGDAARFDNPTGLAMSYGKSDISALLYVADTNNNRLRVMQFNKAAAAAVK